MRVVKKVILAVINHGRLKEFSGKERI